MRRLWVVFGLTWILSGAVMASGPFPADSAVDVEPVAAVHADSFASLNGQLTAWLIAQFDAQGSKVKVDPQGAWGLGKDWLPDVRVLSLTQRRTLDGWQAELTVAPVLVDRQAMQVSAVLRFKVVELQAVWVLGAPVRKGDEVSCALLRQDTRVMRVGQDRWHGTCESLAGLKVRHALQPGDILMASDVGPANAVQDRQETVVITRLGGVEIQAKGVALADAQIGQKVPVRLGGQANVIQTVVTAPGIVQVIEGM